MEQVLNRYTRIKSDKVKFFAVYLGAKHQHKITYILDIYTQVVI